MQPCKLIYHPDNGAGVVSVDTTSSNSPAAFSGELCLPRVPTPPVQVKETGVLMRDPRSWDNSALYFTE